MVDIHAANLPMLPSQLKEEPIGTPDLEQESPGAVLPEDGNEPVEVLLKNFFVLYVVSICPLRKEAALVHPDKFRVRDVQLNRNVPASQAS